MTQLTIHTKDDCIEVKLEKTKAEWLLAQLEVLSIFNTTQRTIAQLTADFEATFSEDFELFWYSKPIVTLKESGLLIV